MRDLKVECQFCKLYSEDWFELQEYLTKCSKDRVKFNIMFNN
jgi:hypothetical protein